MAINTKAIQDLIKKIQDLPKKAVTKKVAEEMGKAMTEEMKDLISKGISPIRGQERFPAYKRAGEKDGYPANQKRRYPAKKNRPVNLYLSGDFLKNLQFRAVSGREGFNINLGYFDETSSLKEKGHREGANGQPKRPTIPQGKEEFAVSVQEKALDILEKAVTEYVKKL